MAVSVLARFIADEWFKIMMILCFLLLVAALTFELQFDNLTVMLLSLAGTLWGIGEMACRPYREIVTQDVILPGYAKMSGRPRRLNMAGFCLFTLALLVAGAGAYRLWLILPLLLVG
ncbi:hypothetical protein SAMN05216198_1536 [Halopseudomonas litoralis]|uniref:Uncharacterized protein n=1 Tax=Halopseudomonas litoralis TaxID=797277 RepID=A0A1H1QND3_9GAMM|nr:hypothetical protein [Halopseudomonas litoralis]SDS24982.1 hypothetical protein SAMN05216198_1536 [Halopseudomonas litoralis]